MSNVPFIFKFCRCPYRASHRVKLPPRTISACLSKVPVNRDGITQGERRHFWGLWFKVFYQCLSCSTCPQHLTPNATATMGATFRHHRLTASLDDIISKWSFLNCLCWWWTIVARVDGVPCSPRIRPVSEKLLTVPWYLDTRSTE